MTSSEIFKKETVMGQRYRRIEDQKQWLCLALKQDLIKGNGLNQQLKSANGKRVSVN